MKYIALITFHFGNVLFFIFSALVGIFFLLAISSDPLVSLFFSDYDSHLDSVYQNPHQNQNSDPRP